MRAEILPAAERLYRIQSERVIAERDAADEGVAAHIDGAAESAQAWLKSHRAVRELDNTGSYDEAVKLAIDGEAAGSSAPAFSAPDRSLDQAVDTGRQLFVNDTMSAAGALTFLTLGWAAVAVIAVGGVVVGLGQRLREYR